MFVLNKKRPIFFRICLMCLVCLLSSIKSFADSNNWKPEEFCNYLVNASPKGTSHGQNARDVCLNSLDGSAEQINSLFDLHKEAAVSVTKKQGNWWLYMTHLDRAIGIRYKNESIKLMSYYMDKYHETNNVTYAVFVSNMGYESGHLLRGGEHKWWPPLPSDWLSQYGEFLATLNSWYAADSEYDYVWAKARAERLANSRYSEIRKPSLNIMREARKMYKTGPQEWSESVSSVLETLVALGQMMPDTPPQSYRPPENSWTMDLDLLWVQ